MSTDVSPASATRRFVEPTSLVPLNWGSYSIRLYISYACVGLGTLLFVLHTQWLIALGAILFAAGIAVFPGAVRDRAIGVAIAILVTVASLFPVGVVAAILAPAAGLASWLVVRKRPGVSWWLAIPVLALGVVSYLWFLTLADVALAIGMAWLARAIAVSRAKRSAVAGGMNAEAAHAARVQAIRQWEAAYAEVHPGEPIPPMPASYAPLDTSSSTAGTTNVFAVLGFIFGLMGGALGVVFGIVGLVQIKNTGQKGRGLAITGIVLFAAWIAVLVIVGLVFAAHR